MSNNAWLFIYLFIGSQAYDDWRLFWLRSELKFNIGKIDNSARKIYTNKIQLREVFSSASTKRVNNSWSCNSSYLHDLTCLWNHVEYYRIELNWMLRGCLQYDWIAVYQTLYNVIIFAWFEVFSFKNLVYPHLAFILNVILVFCLRTK